jgi:HK97 gp10 family phage protein
MAKVTGTKGNVVSYEVKGIAELLKKMEKAKVQIENGADLGVMRAASFVEEELKESIAGRRPAVSVKSVDTGLFLNSIEVKRLGKAEAKVYPRRKKYPNSNQTTQDVALALEKGTSRILPRRHFKNTETRNKDKIKKIIDEEIKHNMAASKLIS